MSDLSAIISQINEHVDAQDLVRLINYFPEKAQTTGSSLKCFCPVHKEMAFRSLVLDLKHHTYKCMMRRCTCFEGGTFVELWAHHNSLAPVEAALDLAEKLEIPLDDINLDGLVESYTEQAKAALEAGDLDEARVAVDTALGLSPRDPHLHLLSATLHEECGAPEQALELRLQVFDGWLADEQIEEASSLFDEIVSQAPDDSRILERRVLLARKAENQANLVQALLEKVTSHERNDQLDEALNTLNETIQLRPSDPELLERYAGLLTKGERTEDLDRILQRLVTVYTESGQPDQALITLQRRAELNPDDISVREAIAAALMARGRIEEAHQCFMNLIEQHAAQGRFDDAADLLGKLLKHDPSNMDLIERQARLLQQAGQDAEAVQAYRDLAALAREQGQHEHVNVYYDLGRAIDPQNLGLRRDQAQWKLESGETESALNDLFQLADLSLRAGETSEGMDLLDRICELAADDLDKRLRVGRCLERNDLEDEAFNRYIQLIDDLIDKNQLVAARAVCEEVRRLRPLDQSTLALQVKTCLAAGHKSEALEACRETARAYEAAGDIEAAEEALLAATKIDRTDLGVKTDLARLFEKLERRPDAAELWIEMALIHRAQENHENANQAIRAALDLDPTHREARMMLAEGLEATNHIKAAFDLWKELAQELSAEDPNSAQALEFLRHAASLNSDDDELPADIARMTLAIEGAQAAQPCFQRWLDQLKTRTDSDEIIAVYRLAVENYPDQFGWRLALAQRLLDAGAHDEASEHFELLLQSVNTGDLEQKQSILEKLVSLRPDRSEHQADLARTLAAQGNEHQAVSLFKELAENHLVAGEIDQAHVLYREALELAPNHSDLIQRNAELYEQSDQTDKALTLYEKLAELNRRKSDRALNIPVLEKLLELDPAKVDLRLELAAICESDGDIDQATHHLQAAAVYHAQQDHGEQVIQLCRRIKALDPQLIETRELMVEQFVAANQLDEAKAELDELGDLTLAAGEDERAETYFRRVRDIDPDDIASNERLGKLYEARGMIDEAAQAYDQVLALYEKAGETTRAVNVLQKLKQFRPNDRKLRRNLARCLLTLSNERRDAGDEWFHLLELSLKAGKKKEAAKDYSEALPHLKHDWPWRRRVALLFNELTDDKRALAAWQELAADALEAEEFEAARDAVNEGLQIADQPHLREMRIEANCRLSNFEAAAQDLSHLAESAAASEQYDDAIACLDRALELLPNDAHLRATLAETQLTAGHRDKAIASFQSLIALLRQADQFEEAIRHARRLVQLDPDRIELREHLASLLNESGHHEHALDLWCEMAESCAASGDLSAAITRYTRLLDQAPGNIQILRRLADLTYEEGGMIQAMVQFDRLVDTIQATGDLPAYEAELLRILDMEPGHLQIKERLAEFLVENDRHEEACNTWMEIAVTYRDERAKYDDALRILRRLETLNPEDIEIRKEEAALLEMLERVEEAGALWRRIAQHSRREGDLKTAAGCLVHCADLEPEKVQAQIEAAEQFEAIDEPDKATHYYLRAIDIFDRNDEHSSCVNILKRAIAINPLRFDLADALARVYERLGDMNSASAQWLSLGTLYEEQNQMPKARQVYAHLRTLMPAEMECRRRLVRLCRQDGERSTAAVELRELARLASKKEDLEEAAEYLQGLLELQPGDEASARNLAEIWRKLERPEALYQTLSNLERHFRSSGNYAEAINVLDELLTLRPGEPDLMGRSIELMIQTNRLEDAARQGIELIQVYFDLNEDALALETLRQIAEIDSSNLERRISLARLVHANGRESAALQEFVLTASKLFDESQWEPCLSVCESGLQLFPDDVRLRDLMAQVLLKLDRESEAIEVQLHLAVLYDERGEEVKAERVYESILQRQPDNKATLEAMVDWALRHERDSAAVEHLVRLAECHYLDGELKPAIDALERTQTLAPGRNDLRARLGEIYLESGDQTGACQTWATAARAMQAEGDHNQATALYRRILEHDPAHLEALENLFALHMKAGHKADQETIALQLSERYLAGDEIVKSIEILESLVDAHPASARGWEKLAGLYPRLDQIDKTVEAYRHLSSVHRSERRLDQAREALEAARALAPDDAAMLEELGDLCLALGSRPTGIEHLERAIVCWHNAEEWQRAANLAQRILKLDPVNLSVRRRLGEAYEALGDPQAAIEEFVQAARGMADAQHNDEAVELLSHLLTLDPGRQAERELYARILNRVGRTDESLDQYLLLLDSLNENDDPRRGIKFCRQILAENPDHPQAHVHLCSIYERGGKTNQALKECEWLTDYYHTKGLLKEAERYIQKGLGWFPEDLGMRKRLVELLVEMDQPARAGEQLRELAATAETRSNHKMTAWALGKACEIEPDNLDHYRRLADFQEQVGELVDARETRMSLIARMLEQHQFDEARQLAERVVESVIEDDELRQQIAQMFEKADLPEVAAFHYCHMAQRAYANQQFDECRELADHTLQIKPRHVEALELLIKVLLAQGENSAALVEQEKLYAICEEIEDWEGALSTLESMIEVAPSKPQPRVRLIALFGRLHREEAMIEQMRRLVEIYVNAGDFDNALSTLRELMQTRPEDTRARVRYIDLYTQVGDETDLTEDYLQLARILARKGSVVEATRTFEKVLATHPEHAPCREEFIQFLLEQGQIHRAIDESRTLAEQYQNAGAFKEAARMLERALNYAPEELDLRQRLADIYLNTNRRGLALETYRSLARQYDQASMDRQLVEVIERIVEIDQLNVEFRQRLADLYERFKETEKACAQHRTLAMQYIERELYDLAEMKLRKVLETQPEDCEIWDLLIQTHEQMGNLDEILPEMNILAETYTRKGELNKAVDIYRRILSRDPENLEVLSAYIDVYVQIGLEQDLVDDYLNLADLRIKRGEVAESIAIYRHLIEIAPDNAAVQEKLSETQAFYRKHGGNPETIEKKKSANVLTPDSQDLDVNDPEARQKVIRNYENILKLNPKNPQAHTKLAQVLQNCGDQSAADRHWAQAAAFYFEKGDLKRCIGISEDYLKRHPDDARVRERLSRALVQLDSLRVIDGALSDNLG